MAVSPSRQVVALIAAVTLTVGVAGCTGPTASTAESTGVEHMIERAVAQVGDRYVFGVEVSETDADPNVWDQGEFTQWSAHQAGSEIPGSTVEQYLKLESEGLLVPLEDGVNTRGALLFHFSREPQQGGPRPDEAHVALSLGGNRTVEAQSQDAGVVIAANATDRFEYAALLPGLNYPAVELTPTTRTASPTSDPGSLNIDVIMSAIKAQESHGDYQAEDATSTASGAYLYIDSEWAGFGGYIHASDAPPAVQDAKMRADSEATYQRLHDWERVIAAHYVGEEGQAGPKSDWDRVPGRETDDRPSIREFVDAVLQDISTSESVAPVTTG